MKYSRFTPVGINTGDGNFNTVEKIGGSSVVTLTANQMPSHTHTFTAVSYTHLLSPPSVPHLSIDWYKEGGILTKPTVFGMNGSSLMAGGEAGKEAVLPLKGFYDQLEHILSSRMNTGKMERCV